LDDLEARYLIDQFNKYASWFLKGKEPMYALTALGLTGSAILFTMYAILGVYQLLPNFVVWIWFFGIIFAMAYLYRKLQDLTKLLLRENEDNRKRLIALENYRMKHRSLPDETTFEKIVGSSPEDLEKLLGSIRGE
jgi:hypothetical protein